MQAAIASRGFGQGVGQAHEQVFLLIHELIGDCDVQKQSRRIQLIGRARLFVLAGLQKIRAITRTIERHFALLAAALRANTPVNRGTEALLFPDFADRTTQGRNSSNIMALREVTTLARTTGPFWRRRCAKPCNNALSRAS